jgi:hypothetical protein
MILPSPVFSSAIMGVLAGGILTASSLPRAIDRLKKLARRRSAFSYADLCRDAMQAIGNALWIYVDLSSGIYASTLFCLINCLLQLSLCLLNLLRLRGKHANTADKDGSDENAD